MTTRDPHRRNDPDGWHGMSRSLATLAIIAVSFIGLVAVYVFGGW
jgi:hypothetical protein